MNMWESFHLLTITDSSSMSHSSSSSNRRMSSSSSIDEHRRQGSITSLPDDDEDADQKTITTDSLIFHQQYSSSLPSKSPPMVSSSKGFDVQQAPPTAFFLRNDHRTQSDSTDDISATFEFQSNQTEEPEATIDAVTDAAIPMSEDQSSGLFFDPNPEIIHKPQMIAPIIYKQNITIKFLKPPSIPQAPLIIREVRPPQPPPPPPLIIRQRPSRPLSPPPLILREKPPAVPPIITAQVVTKMLPPLPTPPRTVIVQKIPPLPAKPPDVLIERWMPYSTITKRKVIIERAEEPQKYPSPKNIIIEYDKPEARVVQHFERLGTTVEDPESYQRRFANVLLEPEELLAQVKQLGINEDLSLPQSSEETIMSSNTTFEPINRVMNSDEVDRQLLENAELFDLTAEFSKYGLTPDSIPH